MNVAQLMSKELVEVEPNDSVEEAVRLLRRRGIRHLVVTKNGRLVGIVSDRDIKRALDPRRTRKKLMDIGGLYFLLEPILVEEIMTPDPTTIGPEVSVAQAACIMVERRFGALPVTRNNRVLGIVTETDLLRHFATECMERERSNSRGAATRTRAMKRAVVK